MKTAQFCKLNYLIRFLKLKLDLETVLKIFLMKMF